MREKGANDTKAYDSGDVVKRGRPKIEKGDRVRKTEGDYSYLTDMERFALDAYTVNGDRTMAYLVSRARPGERTNSTENNVWHWFAMKPVKDYLSRKRMEADIRAKVNAGYGDVMDYTDKGTILRELAKEANAATNAKERAAILMQIAELQRMKQDENREEEERVHFYLPLTCDKCELLKIKKLGEKRVGIHIGGRVYVTSYERHRRLIDSLVNIIMEEGEEELDEGLSDEEGESGDDGCDSAEGEEINS